MGTNRIDSRAQLADLNEKYGEIPHATFIGECTCGGVVSEQSDGTVYDWRSDIFSRRIRHSCAGSVARAIVAPPTPARREPPRAIAPPSMRGVLDI